MASSASSSGFERKRTFPSTLWSPMLTKLSSAWFNFLSQVAGLGFHLRLAPSSSPMVLRRSFALEGTHFRTSCPHSTLHGLQTRQLRACRWSSFIQWAQLPFRHWTTTSSCRRYPNLTMPCSSGVATTASSRGFRTSRGRQPWDFTLFQRAQRKRMRRTWMRVMRVNLTLMRRKNFHERTTLLRKSLKLFMKNPPQDFIPCIQMIVSSTTSGRFEETASCACIALLGWSPSPPP